MAELKRPSPGVVSPRATAPSEDDADLLDQVRLGDPSAFGHLVTQYQTRVLNACWRISGSWEDAQDLTQEAFLRAFDGIDRFERKSGFYTWLFRIAVNLAVSQRRRNRRGVQLSLHDGNGQWSNDHQAAGLVERVSGNEPDPSAAMSQKETQERVVQALDRLGDEQRTIIVLKDIEQMDYQQIAAVLEISLGTVKSRLHRARLALQAELREIARDELP